MKILLISNIYPSKSHASYGTFVLNFKNQLESEGFEIDLSVIRGRGKSAFEKIKKYFEFIKTSIKKIKKQNYDIIYVHYISHSLVPLLIVKKIVNKPLVINAHGGDVLPISKKGKLLQKFVYPVIKKANLVVVPSEYFKSVVMKKLKIDKDKIFVSPSGGVDLSVFKPISVKKSKEFTIGMVSRIEDGKGWDVFLDALYILKERGLKFKAMVIGGGTDLDKFEKRVSQLKLNSIIEHAQAKAHSQLPIYFNIMDVFVFPTKREESLGLVGIEAMACSVPVIGSKIGGLKGYIKSGYNGELFEPGNSIQLAQLIERFIDMKKEQRSRYKDNAIKTAKKYDEKVVKENIVYKLYHCFGDK